MLSLHYGFLSFHILLGSAKFITTSAFLFFSITFPFTRCERDCCFLKLSLKPSGLLRRRRRKLRWYSSHPPVTPYACMCRQWCIWAGFKRVIQLQLFGDALCHFLHVHLQVRELYKGALGKLQQLHPFLVLQGTLGEGDGRIRIEVEKEAVRRKNLGSQLKSLLDRQLEVTFPPYSYKKQSILKAIDWLFI